MLKLDASDSPVERKLLRGYAGMACFSEARIRVFVQNNAAATAAVAAADQEDLRADLRARFLPIHGWETGRKERLAFSRSIGQLGIGTKVDVENGRCSGEHGQFVDSTEECPR